MKFTTLKLIKQPSRFVLGVVGAGMLLAAALPPVVAQTTTPASPLEDLQTKDSADLFGGRGNGQGSSIMNFIQNAIIGKPRSSDEFVSDQKENFDDATAKFRAQQAERLRKQQPNPTSTVPAVPAPAN